LSGGQAGQETGRRKHRYMAEKISPVAAGKQGKGKRGKKGKRKGEGKKAIFPSLRGFTPPRGGFSSFANEIKKVRETKFKKYVGKWC